MSLNLIADPWIPVIDTAGQRRVIAPWQMADPDILRPDWGRADLNIACYELLIGLVFLADPPADHDDWVERYAPDPPRLRQRLDALAPAFYLLGDGPRFMQDQERIEGAPNPVDMLFIDSAGDSTIKKNADLMVRRGRYPALSLPVAAMAIYALQQFAPSGGAGNRTSMRGGGPMVTLVQPQEAGLWATVWANMPYGQPADQRVLPWMRPAVTSEKRFKDDDGAKVHAGSSHPAVAFFGMPRRLRLVAGDDLVTGVIQRPWGENYAGWDHPLTPYYRVKVSEDWLPRHPRAGLFGYRNWLGVVAAVKDGPDALARQAESVRLWSDRQTGTARLIVAGWSMDNMKPRDFVLSQPPFVNLDDAAALMLNGMVEAAEQFGLALRAALSPVLADGEAREAAREEFFALTQTLFETRLGALEQGVPPAEVAPLWRDDLRRVALSLFDGRALPGLADRKIEDQHQIAKARGNLLGAFSGRGKYGGPVYGALQLVPPVKTKQEAA